MKEAIVEKFLTKHVTRHGGLIYKIAFIGRRGAPDRLVIWPNGEVDFIEVKRPSGVISPIQKKLHELWQKQNKSVYVLFSLAEVDAYLKARRECYDTPSNEL
jgi:hypothetical protein